MLREKAEEAGIEIEIVESLCDGAFDAVLAGDSITHDRILSQALRNEMKGVDVVIPAQASMARVVKTMPNGTLSMPVLSSPKMAVLQARDVMAGLNGAPELVASNGRQGRR